MYPEDERLGRLLKLIRTRTGLTQVQLAARAGVPLPALKRVEAGAAGNVRLDRIRSLYEAVDGRARTTAWWNGAAADRLLDERHAAIVEIVVRLFRERGWEVFVELSFSEFGERGSIDVFGLLPSLAAVAVCEVKSIIGSLEETNRTLDAKVRLAPTITFKRLGWRPRVVGRVLIMPGDMTLRRSVERHASTMNAIYPGRSREVRAWLRNPAESMSAIWFVSNRSNTTTLTA
jgi:transcriptional regulator with XRE-family HTH domain